MTEDHPWRAAIHDRLAESLELSNRAREVARQVEELTGDATSADRTVRVLVDHHGFVQQVVLGDRAREHEPERLSALVVEVTAAAVEDLQRQIALLQAQVTPAEPVDLTDTSLLDDLDAVLRGTIRPEEVR